jgi:hypothetical protein
MTDTNVPATKEVEIKIDNATVEILQQIQLWHKKASEQLATLLDNGKAGITLDLGEELKVKLTEETAGSFRIALLICTSLFGTLPFTLSPPEDAVEAEVADLPEA